MIPEGFSIDFFETVDSTQIEALGQLQSSLIAGRFLSGRVIMAERQTKGRGRQGRVWDSPKGNLAATLIWPLPSGQNPGDYSLIVAVAMADSVASFLENPANLMIKWPNDLLAEGKKICGILIERPEPEWLLIGTGVNIMFAPDGRARLADFCDNVPSACDLLCSYLKRFKDWMKIYKRDGLSPICAAWMSRAYGVGSDMTVQLPQESFQAIFKGLDLTDGACMAELPNGTIRRVHSGEVFF